MPSREPAHLHSEGDEMTHIKASLMAAVAAGALLAPSLLGTGTAFAQGMLGGSNTTRRPTEPPRREPPPALPGVAANRGQAPIPAEVPPSSMNPNDAMFDGINRGDIATVRDAVARGADVNSRNALGLTAIDSAVDQGRPEIMFYLLSMRGSAGNAPPPPERGAANPRPERAPARVRTPPPSAAREESQVQTGTVSPRLPQLWQANGGTPQPSIGFLGFDAGTPAGASRPSQPVAATRRGRI
ncbi:MAG: hypothetical protein JWR10_3088 [Rubritepida sp.]|nr:hypothetical protein [Rubritepida sp.]